MFTQVGNLPPEGNTQKNREVAYFREKRVPTFFFHATVEITVLASCNHGVIID